MSSRSINDISPEVRDYFKSFLDKCVADQSLKDQGVTILVTCTHRTDEEQNALYAIGRTIKGHIETCLKGGQSYHNGMIGGIKASHAIDIVPVRHGKLVWGTAGDDLVLWNYIGALGESCGLEWAGRWTGKLKEMAHFQKK